MKRLLVSVLMLMALMAVPVFAGTLSYVYGNSLSSVDFQQPPATGSFFVDEDGNVLVVRETDASLVRFDSYISRKPYRVGSSLEARSFIKNLCLYSGIGYSLVSAGIVGPGYPFDFSVLGGLSYGKVYGTGSLVLAGVGVSVPLANLWDSDFTLILNGKLHGLCAFGVSVAQDVGFAMFDTVSYRHNIGNFRWELGVSVLDVTGKSGITLSPMVAVGVEL